MIISKDLIEPAELDFYDGLQFGEIEGNIDDIVEREYKVWVSDYESNLGKTDEDGLDGWVAWIKNNPENYSKSEILEKFKEAFLKALKDYNSDAEYPYKPEEFGINI